MDFFVQVSPCMGSDRVGSYFWCFSKRHLWCHISNKCNGLSYRWCSRIQNTLSAQFACSALTMSTTANSQTINSNSSPDQMKTSPSLAFFFFLPPLPHSFSIFVSTTPLSRKLVRSRNGRWWYNVNVGHTDLSAMLDSWTSLLIHMCRYKTVIHHHMLKLSHILKAKL